MRGRIWPQQFWVASALLAAGLASGAEPVPRQAQQNLHLQQLRFDDRPNWLRPVDNAAREGLKFMCLRPGRDSDLILGAHPDGYIGVFTTLPRGRRRRGSC